MNDYYVKTTYCVITRLKVKIFYVKRVIRLVFFKLSETIRDEIYIFFFV